jgi:hypothetical protein
MPCPLSRVDLPLSWAFCLILSGVACRWSNVTEWAKDRPPWLFVAFRPQICWHGFVALRVTRSSSVLKIRGRGPTLVAATGPG